MQRLTRGFLGFMVACLLVPAGWLAAPSAAHAAGGDTTAVAINTHDGLSLFRLAFAVRRVAGGVVDETNAAVAYASCEQCQTVAVAFQVVLLTADPDVVAPENYAIAVNEGCNSCETLASAYQFVLGTDGPVRFSPEGNRRLADVRRRLQQLRRSELGIEEIQAELDDIADEVRAVLRNELVRAGRPPDELRTDPETDTARPTRGAS